MSEQQRQMVEIVDPSGNVSYRRPPGDPLIEEARRTHGYSVRMAEALPPPTPEELQRGGHAEDMEHFRQKVIEQAGIPANGWTSRRCPTCKGNGDVFDHEHQEDVPCPDCGGTGDEYVVSPVEAAVEQVEAELDAGATPVPFSEAVRPVMEQIQQDILNSSRPEEIEWRLAGVPTNADEAAIDERMWAHASDGHEWCPPDRVIQHEYCRRCLVIRRADRANPPCKGPGKLTFKGVGDGKRI